MQRIGSRPLGIDTSRNHAKKWAERRSPIITRRVSESAREFAIPLTPNPSPVKGEGRRSGAIRGHRRGGFSLIELAITAILLGVVMLTAIPTLAWIVRARHAAERQQAAVLGVGNLMERVTSLRWDEIASENIAGI